MPKTQKKSTKKLSVGSSSSSLRLRSWTQKEEGRGGRGVPHMPLNVHTYLNVPPPTTFCTLCYLRRSLSLNAQCFPVPCPILGSVISPASSPDLSCPSLQPHYPNWCLTRSTSKIAVLCTFSSQDFLSPTLSLFSGLSPRGDQCSHHPTSFARAICFFRNRFNWWSFRSITKKSENNSDAVRGSAEN